MAYIRERKTKDGKSVWDFTLDAGRDPITGKRKQKTVRGFSSEKEARRASDKLAREIEQGKRSDSITVSEFGRLFMEKEVRHQVTYSTYENQFQWFRDYIEPTLGKKRLDKIVHMDIVEFYNALLERGCSRGLIKNVDMVLSKIFKQARIWRYLVVNVMEDITPPSYRPRKMMIWTKDEVIQFLRVTEGSELHALYMVAFSTGMRIGEILGLTWDDIDFEDGTISITKTMKYTSRDGLHHKFPKTDNSLRTINVPAAVIETLKKHQAGQLPDVKIVFDNIGNPYYPNNVTRKFQTQCKKLGFPVIRFHDIRHTHASHLLDRHNAKIVAERLGDTVETVLKTYAHVLPNMQKEVAAGIESEYFKPVDNSSNVID